MLSLISMEDRKQDTRATTFPYSSSLATCEFWFLNQQRMTSSLMFYGFVWFPFNVGSHHILEITPLGSLHTLSTEFNIWDGRDKRWFPLHLVICKMNITWNKNYTTNWTCPHMSVHVLCLWHQFLNIHGDDSCACPVHSLPLLDLQVNHSHKRNPSAGT